MLKRRLFGFALPLLLLAGCAGTSASGTKTVTVQVPTTVFVTGSDPAAAPAAASETSAPAPAETTAAAAATGAPVGTSIPFTWSSFGDKDQGVATLNTAEWTTEPPDQFSGAPKNGAYLILDVTIEGTQGSVSVNPLYWQARDADGRTYDFSFTSKEPALSSGDVLPGQKSRGFVVLDAPQVPVTVELTNMGPALAMWAVPA